MVLLYSSSDQSIESITDQVKTRFGISVDHSKINIVKLKKAYKLRPERYTQWTLLYQSLAYLEVCAEAMSAVPCDLFIDTMGVGMAYPLVKIVFGAKILSYTHYPMISSDMIEQISTVQFNNQSSSSLKKFIKRIYYRFLMVFYMLGGKAADQILTNSTWTDDHMRKLWNKPD